MKEEAYENHKRLINKYCNYYYEAGFDSDKAKALFDNALRIVDKREMLLVESVVNYPKESTLAYIFKNYKSERKNVFAIAKALNLDFEKYVEETFIDLYTSEVKLSESKVEAVKKEILLTMEEFGIMSSNTIDQINYDELNRIALKYLSATESEEVHEIIDDFNEYDAPVSQKKQIVKEKGIWQLASKYAVTYQVEESENILRRYYTADSQNDEEKAQNAKKKIIEIMNALDLQTSATYDRLEQDCIARICGKLEDADEETCNTMRDKIMLYDALEKNKKIYLDKIQKQIETIWTKEDGEIFDNVYHNTNIYNQNEIDKAIEFIRGRGRTSNAERYIAALQACNEKNIKNARKFQKKSTETSRTIGIVLLVVGIIGLFILPILSIIAIPGIALMIRYSGLKKNWNILTLDGMQIHKVININDQEQAKKVELTSVDKNENVEGVQKEKSTKYDLSTFQKIRYWGAMIAGLIIGFIMLVLGYATAGICMVIAGILFCPKILQKLSSGKRLLVIILAIFMCALGAATLEMNEESLSENEMVLTEESVSKEEITSEREIVSVDNAKEFTEDWFLEHYYYIDSNGEYFVLSHSDSILQIDIADVSCFNVDFTKYKKDYEDEFGEVYVYYDIATYTLIKYYPQFNNTIIIEAESGEITCTNVSEAEYLAAERAYAETQLDGFSEDWYKGKYLSDSSYEIDRDWFMGENCYYDGSEEISQYMGYRQISHKNITDTSDIFTLEVDPVFEYMSENVVVDFFSDEYKIDYENYGHIYETTNSDGVIIYLEYFPKDNKLRVYDEYESIGGASVETKTYYLISEEEIKELSRLKMESEEENEALSVESNIDYFVTYCDMEYFTEDNLWGFDSEMCRIARNGIYARSGRVFQDEALNNYFLGFDWYNPTISPDDFSEDMLNEYQIANRDLVIEYEKTLGNDENVESYVGEWWDSYSQRCWMEITCQNGKDYDILINWGQDASTNYVWELEGYYDGEIQGISYTGKHILQKWDMNGQEYREIIYEDGEGALYITEDGYLLWKDEVEGQGDDCIFEK